MHYIPCLENPSYTEIRVFLFSKKTSVEGAMKVRYKLICNKFYLGAHKLNDFHRTTMLEHIQKRNM